jgi:hypothetical protein
MDGHSWFNFPPPQIHGCDFEEIFLLSIPKNFILSYTPIEVISSILNRGHLDHNDNSRYDTIERIRTYDKEEYYYG